MQLDDQLVTELDRLAAAEGTSRSELVRRGVLAVIEAAEVAEVAEVDQVLQAAYRRIPPDPALVETARRLAAGISPPW